jgi:hypothetical protein
MMRHSNQGDTVVDLQCGVLGSIPYVSDFLLWFIFVPVNI